MKEFPVLGKTGSVKFVNWNKLDEEAAQNNHYQSLTKLASRGGLCWEELYWNYYNIRLGSPIDKNKYKEMVDDIKC